MQVVHPHCAGLDVHKKTVVACAITPNHKGGWHKEIETFSTMTCDLLRLSDWLTQRSCSHVAMESTGEYWRPVFNIMDSKLRGDTGQCCSHQECTRAQNRYQGSERGLLSYYSMDLCVPVLFPHWSSETCEI